MELTKEMKEKLEKAKTKEEVKKVLDEAGVELTDEELDQAAGGCGIVEYALILCYCVDYSRVPAMPKSIINPVINPVINPPLQ